MPHWCLTYLYLSPSPKSTVGGHCQQFPPFYSVSSVFNDLLKTAQTTCLFQVFDIWYCRSFLLLPSTFPCRAVVIRYVCLLLLACPTYLSLLLYISFRRCLCTDSSSRMLLFVRASMSTLFSEYVYRTTFLLTQSAIFLFFLGSKLKHHTTILAISEFLII